MLDELRKYFLEYDLNSLNTDFGFYNITCLKYNIVISFPTKHSISLQMHCPVCMSVHLSSKVNYMFIQALHSCLLDKNYITTVSK